MYRCRMKLLLLNDLNLSRWLSSFKKSLISTFSFIGLIHVRQLAALTPKNHSVQILDGNKTFDFDDEYDAVYITFKTPVANTAYKVADEFRRRNVKVILGGYHPSVLPEEAKQHADGVIVGGDTDIWPTLIKDLENKKLKPLYKSMDHAKDVPKLNQNLIGPSSTKLVDIVQATHGCPYKCDFCQYASMPNGFTFRTRPVEEVAREIDSLPHKIFVFNDASLTIDPSYTKSLFSEIKGLNKKFVCEGNVDILANDEEFLKLAHEVGCIEWTVGFESFSQKSLNDVHKKTNNVEEYAKAVKKLHDYNMAVVGTFVFGFDGDTVDTFDVTLNHIDKLKLDAAIFAILTPYPGTPLFKRLEVEGRILTKDWSKYTRKDVVFQPKNMTKEELEEGYKEITKHFNFFPRATYRVFRTMSLGFYPSLATFAGNIGSYMASIGK